MNVQETMDYLELSTREPIAICSLCGQIKVTAIQLLHYKCPNGHQGSKQVHAACKSRVEILH